MEIEDRPRTPDETVRSVQRAFAILAAFTPDQPSATLSALARSSGLPVSTVSRLLATLESLGFVRRLASGAWGLGVRMLQLGLAARAAFDIVDLAEPHLAELNRATQENANLAVLVDAEHWSYVRQIMSRHPVRHATWVGRTQPVKGSANGAALLGRVGVEGYAATRRTIEPDITAIAAPVRAPGGEVVAAVSATGPTYRIPDDVLEHYGRLVVEAAKRISRELGTR